MKSFLRNLLVLGCVVISLFGGQSLLGATAISVANPSFETPPLSDGGFNLSVSIWQTTNIGSAVATYVTWNPTVTYYDGVGIDVTNILEITYHDGSDPDSDYVYQDLSTTLQPGKTYTLTVAVGYSAGNEPPALSATNFVLDISTSDMAPGTYLARYAGTLSEVTANELVDKSVTFTGVEEGNSHIGHPLRILLGNTSPVAPSPGVAVAFDNVRLSYTNVPPPSGSTPISVANPGFETPTLSEGGWQVSVNDWQTATIGDAGYTYVTWNPTAQYYDGALDNGTPVGGDGANIAEISYTGGSDPASSYLYQDLSPTLQPGKTYTLTVAVGYSAGNLPPALSATNFVLDISTSDMAPGTYLARYAGPVSELAANELVDRWVTFKGMAGNPHIGHPLRILLGNTSPVSPNQAVAFDNVRLNFISEPPMGTLISIR